MDILIISDLHSLELNNLEKLNNIDYDICFLLGDIDKKRLDLLRTKLDLTKTYGVVGNHDASNTLTSSGFVDLDGKCINVKGINIVGLGYGVKYKSGMYAMRTQDEMLDLVSKLSIESCDILISHDTEYRMITDDKSHEGFLGITKFIEKYKPKYNLFGHHHRNLRFFQNGTDYICTYQCNLLNYETGMITNIF